MNSKTVETVIPAWEKTCEAAAPVWEQTKANASIVAENIKPTFESVPLNKHVKFSPGLYVYLRR